MESIIEILFSFFEQVMALTQTLRDWLFSEVTILGETFSVWSIIGGAGLTVWLGWILIKNVVF